MLPKPILGVGLGQRIKAEKSDHEEGDLVNLSEQAPWAVRGLSGRNGDERDQSPTPTL